MNEFFSSDRDFSEDVVKQQSMVVAQHNDLITKAKYDLTTNEIKVMDYIISKIKPDDEEFDTVHSSLYEISNVLGLKRSGRTYNQLTNFKTKRSNYLQRRYRNSYCYRVATRIRRYPNGTG